MHQNVNHVWALLCDFATDEVMLMPNSHFMTMQVPGRC